MVWLVWVHVMPLVGILSMNRRWELLEAVGVRPTQLSAGPWIRSVLGNCLRPASADAASPRGRGLLRRVRSGYGVEQLDRVVVLGVLQDVLGLASLDDSSVVEYQDLVGHHAGAEQVVGDVQPVSYTHLRAHET